MILSVPRVFVAAPLSTVEQRLYNEKVAEVLALRYAVFLPQRDVGLIESLMVENSWTRATASQYVFGQDVAGLRNSDVVVAVLEAPYVSGGVAAELGMAYALGKACFGIPSQARRVHAGASSPIIDAIMLHVFQDLKQLQDDLDMIAR